MPEYFLLLIKPTQKYKHYSIQTELAKSLGKKATNTSLALPLIAALTPEKYKIKIADEDIESVFIEDTPDIVGITTTTPIANRAFEIADEYRKRGSKVILGGPYASFNYNEAIEHADAIVIGEAENQWEQVLSDFESGNLKNKYTSYEKPEFKKMHLPRWDLIDTSTILSLTVQASRGCPFSCEFCIATEFLGRRMRFRDIDDVVNEIKALPVKNFFFADDNLTINKKYALKLLRKMKGLDVTWLCQSSIDVADDPELLKAMYDAGCRFVLVGFESLNSNSIKETNKKQNLKINYKNQIKRIHNAGIYVYGSFIVGFDNDELDELENIHNFVNEANIPVFMLSMLTAAFGTKLYDRLSKEGRIYNFNTELTSGIFPMMHYNNFSQTDLYTRYLETLQEAYSFKEMYHRTYNLFKDGKFNKKRVDAGVSFLLKLKTMFQLIRRFKFAKDPYKRKMFNDFFALARQGKLAMSEMISMALMLEGVNKNINKMAKNKQGFLEIIAENDKGSWKDMNLCSPGYHIPK